MRRDSNGRDMVAELCDLLRSAGVTPCLCFECRHQASYGPCTHCRCKNRYATETAAKKNAAKKKPRKR